MNQFLLFSFLLLVSLNSYAQKNIEYLEYNNGYTSFVNDTTRTINRAKKGLLNINHKVLIKPLYDEISNVKFGLIQVQLNNKIGFIDTFGVLKIPFIYDVDTNFIIGVSAEYLNTRDKNSEVTQESIQASIDYNYINFREGLCAVIKNGKYGFIDTLNNVVIPFIYDGADNFYKHYAIVKDKNNYGVIDKSGKIIIPFAYDNLIWYRDSESYICAFSKGVFSMITP